MELDNRPRMLLPDAALSESVLTDSALEALKDQSESGCLLCLFDSWDGEDGTDGESKE